MNVYENRTVEELLKGNPYPGRGILAGMTPDGTRAVAAYFIMGRSRNSRNRVFAEEGTDLFTRPFDPALVEDPSLIIYAAVRQWENCLCVTNGDQTDTVKEGILAGKSFFEALESREFEPDKPNFTPRISALLTFENSGFHYDMSILKSADADGSACARFGFSYPALPGLGHLIHTYVTDGAPLPSFAGEPKRVKTEDDTAAFARRLWDALDPDNRISLYVRTVRLADGSAENILINRYGEEA